MQVIAMRKKYINIFKCFLKNEKGIENVIINIFPDKFFFGFHGHSWERG